MANELYQVQEDTKQNTKDIAILTRTVDRLAVMYESTETTRGEDRELLRELAKTMVSLDKQVTEALHVTDQVRQLKEDMRVMKHDLDNVAGVQINLLPKFEDLTKNDVRQDADIKNLKEWHEHERIKRIKESGGEELKQKTWKTLTAVGAVCATIAGGVMYVANWLLK